MLSALVSTTVALQPAPFVLRPVAAATGLRTTVGIQQEPGDERLTGRDIRLPSREAWLTLLACQAVLLTALVGWMVAGAPDQMRADAALRRTSCAPVPGVCLPVQPLRLRGGFAAPHGFRRRTLLVVVLAPFAALPAFAAAPTKPLAERPAAGPDSNGAMEQRFNLGLPVFTTEYPDPDPEASLPIFPVLGAQRTLDRLLSEEAQFRRLLKAGLPTGELQAPPILSPQLFERLEARAADVQSLREAARAYVRDARDADELLALAQRSRRLGREAEAARRLGEAAVREAELDDYLDKALRACRRASHALARVVTLLPQPVHAADTQAALVRREQLRSPAAPLPPLRKRLLTIENKGRFVPNVVHIQTSTRSMDGPSACRKKAVQNDTQLGCSTRHCVCATFYLAMVHFGRV